MRISVSIPDKLYRSLKKYKGGIIQINVSKICQKALKKEIEKLEKGSEFCG